MTYGSAEDVLARREDADWEMFLRGRGRGGDADPFGLVAGGEAVTLEPSDEGPAPAPGGGKVCHFFAPVVGLPYPNADGTSRREAVRGLRPWERVRLVHWPDNPVDANAVALLRAGDDRQLGYLPAAVAKEVVAAAAAGTRYLALVSEVSGGDASNLISVMPICARLLILALEGGATKAMARAHLLGLMNGTS